MTELIYTNNYMICFSEIIYKYMQSEQFLKHQLL